MNRCFPTKTGLISDVIKELLEHHEDYHQMKFPEKTNVDQRKLAFTLYRYLSVGVEIAWHIDVLSLCSCCFLPNYCRTACPYAMIGFSASASLSFSACASARSLPSVV